MEGFLEFKSCVQGPRQSDGIRQYTHFQDAIYSVIIQALKTPGIFEIKVILFLVVTGVGVDGVVNVSEGFATCFLFGSGLFFSRRGQGLNNEGNYGVKQNKW